MRSGILNPKKYTAHLKKKKMDDDDEDDDEEMPKTLHTLISKFTLINSKEMTTVGISITLQ